MLPFCLAFISRTFCILANFLYNKIRSDHAQLKKGISSYLLLVCSSSVFSCCPALEWVWPPYNLRATVHTLLDSVSVLSTLAILSVSGGNRATRTNKEPVCEGVECVGVVCDGVRVVMVVSVVWVARRRGTERCD